jgi:hypothetical protein
MSGWAKARIQLCGRFAVDIDGARIEDTLPGRRGRTLFAYLVLNRGRPLPREELLMAGWGEEAPAADGDALSVLLSKLRHSLGADRRGGVRRRRGAPAVLSVLRLPAGRRPGGYGGIRNIAAHEHAPDWPQQLALEYLACLSVLARWINEAEVEAAA